MNEILSPDQIAALIEATKSGEPFVAVAPEPEPADGPAAAGTPRVIGPKRVRDVDFSRPVKFTPDQQRRIERAHDAFCRNTGTRLAAELRAEIHLELISLDQLTWSSAIGELPPGSIFGVVGATPLGTHVVLSAEANAILWMVERLLGGSGSATDPRLLHREPSELELALTGRVFQTVVSQLSPIWEELTGIVMSLVEVETLATSLQVAPPSEPTLALTFEIRSESMSSTLSLLIPWRSIEAVAPKLASSSYEAGGESGADEATVANVRRAVSDTEVELRAEVGGVELPMERVLALRPGDVVPLGARAASGILLCVESIPVHRVQPGRSGSRRAVSVIERLAVQR